MSKGDAVEAKLKGWTKYYKGKITRVNRDGTFDILFDDGERKSKVDSKLVRSLERKSPKKKKSSKSKLSIAKDALPCLGNHYARLGKDTLSRLGEKQCPFW